MTTFIIIGVILAIIFFGKRIFSFGASANRGCISKIFWLIIVIFVIVFFYRLISDRSSRHSGGNKNTNPKTEGSVGGQNNNEPTYPTSGKEIATMGKPVKAYLDPLSSHTRIIGGGNAKYVLESDQNRFFICNEKPEKTDSKHIQEWWVMPAGNYLIYPEGVDQIIFSWW